MKLDIQTRRNNTLNRLTAEDRRRLYFGSWQHKSQPLTDAQLKRMPYKQRVRVLVGNKQST